MKQGHNDETPEWEKDLKDVCVDTFSPPEQDPNEEDRAYDALRTQQLINDTNAVCRILRNNPLDTEKMVRELVEYVDSVRRFG